MIKWIITFNRKSRLYTTGIKISSSDAKFLKETNKLDNRLKDSGKVLLWKMCYESTFQERYTGETQIGYLERAKIVLAELGGNFTFEAFAEGIKNFGKDKQTASKSDDLILALHAKAEQLYAENRIGNASNYKSAANSLARFIQALSPLQAKELLDSPTVSRKKGSVQPIIRFKHLTVKFLKLYEDWMLLWGKAPKSPSGAASPASMTTVGIYLRHVRAAFNEAIEQGIIEREAYPFHRSKYTVPASRNVKKALSKADIDKIKAYQSEPGSYEQRSQDLWLLSYYCYGANLSDICRLVWDRVDLEEGKLMFIRQKTARTKRHNQTPTLVILRPEVIEIIKRWGTSRASGQFVFPFINLKMNEAERKKCIAQVIKITNKWMGRIGRQLGIKEQVNTYAARHSFATAMVQSDANLAFVSKALGHSSIKTTENYIGSFDDEEARKYLSNL
jgi:integrase